MTRFSVVVLCLLLALPLRAETYAFRITNWTDPAGGYLKAEIGFGALYLAGYRFPLAGFDSWWHGGATIPGSHMCLIIHPKRPWIVGTIAWHGTVGKIDFLSTDMVWYEFTCNVELIADG